MSIERIGDPLTVVHLIRSVDWYEEALHSAWRKGGPADAEWIKRLGVDNAAQLGAVLATDWGDVPVTNAQQA